MNKLVLLLVLLVAFQARAQFTDSLRIRVGTTATLASKDYQPLWIVANRYGTLTDRQADLATHFSFSNEHIFTSQTVATAGVGPVRKRGFYVQYKADVYNNNHFQKLLLAEGYVKVGYKNFQFRGGRYREYRAS